jgi:hypothetical protein
VKKPGLAAKKIIEWEISDPKGKTIEVSRSLRNFIADKVKAFIREIN